MKKLLKKLALSCAFIPLGTCALATADMPMAMAATTSPAVSESTTAPIPATPAMWVVKDDDTTIYLFGTVHMLRPEIQWFTGDIKAAFDAADTLVLELVMPDDPNALVGPMLARAVDTSGTKLTSRMTEDEAAAYRAAMEKYKMDPAQFEAFQPWFLATALSMAPLQAEGHSPQSGVDMALTDAARAIGKPIVGLETPEEQFGFLASVPMDAQMRWLNETVAQLDTFNSLFEQLLTPWSAGDADGLGKAINAQMESVPELADALLFQRNARWADWIKTRMDQPGTVFIAVGAGHLAGDKSVQDFLAQQGLTVQRLP